MQPHLTVAHVEVRTHDPGQHEDDRLSVPARVCIERSIGTGANSPAGELVECLQAAFPAVQKTNSTERGAGARIPEVVEMVDVGAVVEDVAGHGAARAMEHGVGVDDEVVVAPS